MPMGAMSSSDAAWDYDDGVRAASSSRIARLEAKLVRIDGALLSVEYKLDGQIEVVDMLVDRRGYDDIDDINDVGSPSSSVNKDVEYRMREPPYSLKYFAS